MNTKNKFDLKTFQSEVLDDFNKMKATISLALFHSKGFGSPESFKESIDEPDLTNSLFMKTILKFFSFLGKKANTNILNKSEFIEMENRAAKIVNNPKIKRILCPALRREIRSDLFKEAREVKLVKVVTALLTKKEIAAEFSIEKEIRLFSLIAIKIMQTGVPNYCH